MPTDYVFRHRDSKDDRAAGSGLPRQELAVLQQVMKIAGIDMGSSGAASRLGNAKEMRRKTLEWAEEGDSARWRNEMEQEVEARKRTEEEKQRQKGRLEQERIRQERRQQGRVQQQMQERLEKQRLKEQKVESQRKRLEEQRFDEEEFEERRARKERRLKVKRWLEQQRSLEENNAFKKNIIKEETREKIRKSGKNKKNTTVEIKGIEGKTLIKCEHGKSKMGVKVSITPRSTQHHGSHSSARHRREEDSGDVDSLEGKPDVYRSRAFSDLVRFYESRARETMAKKSQSTHRLPRPFRRRERLRSKRRGRSKKKSLKKSQHFNADTNNHTSKTLVSPISLNLLSDSSPTLSHTDIPSSYQASLAQILRYHRPDPKPRRPHHSVHPLT